MFEIFSYTFFQKALLVTLAVAVACANLGIFLILRRLTLIGDGLSHIAFGGVALGFFLAVAPFEIALIFSLAMAYLIVLLRDYFKVKSDVALGIVFSSSLALGIALISISVGFKADIHTYLFGNLVAISDYDVILACFFSLAVLLFILWKKNELMVLSLDEEAAKLQGVNVERLNRFLVLVTALMTVMTMKVVGTLLVSAFLILPAATALQVSRSFTQAMISSTFFSVVSVLLGIMVASFVDVSPGSAIVLSGILFFVFAGLVKRFA